MQDLKKTVSSQLPDHKVETVVYPKYATKGELAQASTNFLEWYVASHSSTSPYDTDTADPGSKKESWK